MWDKPKIEDLAEKVLRDLEWDSLRTRYQASGARLSISPTSYFHFDPLYTVSRDEEELKWAESMRRQLNSDFRICKRSDHLRDYGLAVYIGMSTDSFLNHLIVQIEFDEKGQTALTGKVH